MNKATAHYINQLLDESELFKSTSHSNNQKQTFDFSEETILITGAAGTIGSGLTSQLLNCNFKKLILVDNAESPFYFLINELELDTKVEVELLLTDIRDESSMQWLFETFKPTIVFHTAAYKHVPMMEAHPYEAVKLNVLATQLLYQFNINLKNSFLYLQIKLLIPLQ
jgi:FlaA1/EpsC-like NDP-sugar epimerase